MLTESRGRSDIIEARSCSHCCSAQAISITYYEGVFVALGTQHAMCMRHVCYVWPVRVYNIFPHYAKKGMIFEKKTY